MNITFGSFGSSQSNRHLTFKDECPNVRKSAQSFTTDFHKNVSDRFHEANFVCSSLSAHVVLAMAAYGTGDTNNKAEMKKALQLPDSDEAACQEFRVFIDTLNSFEKVTLKMASKIYASDKFQIKDSYKEITAAYFRSECTALDFSNGDIVANTVNRWCSEKTNGKIDHIIDPSTVDPDLRMILLNAIYFKGDWKYKFNKAATKPKAFYTSKTSDLNVPTMHIRKMYFYKNLTEVEAQMVAIPYKSPELSMVIILPNRIDGLRELEENLDKVNYDSSEFGYKTAEVILALPKFRIENTIDLNGILQGLGMTQMFQNGQNFPGISDELLKIDQVIQKAFIEVNEEGSEAAAVTCTTMSFGSCSAPTKPPPIEFIVDRPFLYKILWKGVPLFSGHVYNPMN